MKKGKSDSGKKKSGRSSHQPRGHRAKVKSDEFMPRAGSDKANRAPTGKDDMPNSLKRLLAVQEAVKKPKTVKRMKQKLVSARQLGETEHEFEQRMNDETRQIMVSGYKNMTRKKTMLRDYKKEKIAKAREAKRARAEKNKPKVSPEGFELDEDGIPTFPTNSKIIGIVEQANAPPDFRDLHNISGEARLLRKHQEELTKREEARHKSTTKESAERQSIVEQYRQLRKTSLTQAKELGQRS
ncbi:hypothetical protein J8273_4631 [Carpediemonas membranifera]|uniref:Coiled-coil domain-containing protein 137 n=1 Tax=Carpediemonas membranifera TaxID=201153 RepID=A0A8J6B1M1_9EUKA|nr:hypothetical protein J8273_4631 [Carpediemonas membranifera]|eukprot:KAG9393768.1 hypothetical protein J8273_4631 [Carpediemonas membranifera]